MPFFGGGGGGKRQRLLSLLICIFFIKLLAIASMITLQVVRTSFGFHLRSRGRGFVIGMHLCKEYARSATTNTNNTRNIYQRAF